MNFETELNELGKNGWEVVNAVEGKFFKATANTIAIILKKEIAR